MVRWTTVFVDRPAGSFDEARAFWAEVTGTTVSSSRGERDEFSTFLPSEGDAHFRAQRVDAGPGGSHIDLHVDDVRASADRTIALGATEIADLDGVVVLRSPGGLTFCVVRHHGESSRSAPFGGAGERTIVDQACIDIAPDRFDVECDFWAATTGWTLESGRESEFNVLVRPQGMPLRFLLQRRGERDRGLDAGCHLDLACDDVEASTRTHRALGGELVERFSWWTVMADPSGVRYCLTSRSPDTGLSVGH